MTERRQEQCGQSDEGKHIADTTEGGCNEATTGQGTTNAKANAEEGEASDRSRLGRVGPQPRWAGHGQCQGGCRGGRDQRRITTW